MKALFLGIGVSVLLAACGGGGNSNNDENKRSSWQILADAGKNIKAAPDEALTLTVKAIETEQNAKLKFNWSVVDRPDGSLAEPAPFDAINPRFKPDISGDYRLKLEVFVKDNPAIKEESFLAIQADPNNLGSNILVDAGPDQLVATDGNVQINYSTKSVINNNDVTYIWRSDNENPTNNSLANQLKTIVDIESAEFKPLVFDATVAGNYLYTLVVRDNLTGREFEDDVNIKVNGSNSIPVAHAGENIQTKISQQISLNGAKSYDADENTELTYEWFFSSVPEDSAINIENADQPNAQFNPDVAGTYVAVLKVSDGKTKTDSSINSEYDTVIIEVAETNEAPVVEILTSSSGQLTNNDITLFGDRSFDPNGDTLRYTWSLLEKPNTSQASIANPEETNTVFTPDVAGTYRVQLSIADGNTTESKETTINIQSLPPSVSIVKPDNKIQVAENHIINFQANISDPDNSMSELSINWKIKDGGNLSTENQFSEILSLGEHEIVLSVDDNDGNVIQRHIVVNVVEETSLPIKFFGIWEGNGRQPSNPQVTWDYIADFTNFPYVFSSPSLSCTGELTLLESNINRLYLGRKLTQGFGSCIDNSYVELKWNDGDLDITWYERDGSPHSIGEASEKEIENTAPQVSVSSPTTLQIFSSGETITFQGSANDEEDGSLSGTQLVWTTNLDNTEIGTGEQFDTTLADGNHVITLTATDSENLTGNTSINICIGESCEPTILIEEGFENGLGNWEVSNGVWEAGIPTNGPPTLPQQLGKQVAATNLSGNYPTTASSRLISPEIMLPNTSENETIIIDFAHWYSNPISNNDDDLFVHVSYFDENQDQWSDWGSEIASFKQDSQVWSRKVIDISEFMGKKVRISFQVHADGDIYSGLGWYLDDISVRKLEANFAFDFESDWQGWGTSGGLWERGFPSSGPMKTHNGASAGNFNLMGTVLDGDYKRESHGSRLESPTITLPNVASNEVLEVRFWHWFSIPASNNDDFAHFQIQRFVNGEWTDWQAYPNKKFDHDSGVWSRQSVDITALEGETVRLGFWLEIDGDIYSGAGWFIDDVSVEKFVPTFDGTFENGMSDWSVEGGIWEIGMPNEDDNIPNTNNGNNIAGTILSGLYNRETLLGKLISPIVTLPTNNPQLQFTQWVNIPTSNNDDFGQVEISIYNNGAWQDWQVLKTGIDDVSVDWESESVDLSNFAGFQARIAFVLNTDGDTYLGLGWYIDDVKIVEAENP